MTDKNILFLESINEILKKVDEVTVLFPEIFNKLQEFYGFKSLGISEFLKDNQFGIAFTATPDREQLHQAKLWAIKLDLSEVPERLITEQPTTISIENTIIKKIDEKYPEEESFSKVVSTFGFDSVYSYPIRVMGRLHGYSLFPFNKSETSEAKLSEYSNVAITLSGILVNRLLWKEIKRRTLLQEFQYYLFTDVVPVKDLNKFYVKIGEAVQKIIPYDYLFIRIKTFKRLNSFGEERMFSLGLDLNNEIKNLEFSKPQILSFADFIIEHNFFSEANSYELKGKELDSLSNKSDYLKELKEKHSINSIYLIRFQISKLGEMHLVLGKKEVSKILSSRFNLDYLFKNTSNLYFSLDEIDLLEQIFPYLGGFLANRYSTDRIESLVKKLEQEKNYLLEEINLTNESKKIIGKSDAIKQTLLKVQQVAPLEATVLILGETGTGKELIANEIHHLSRRKDKTFITINCAALPAQLIESELFGHEKGSFTGAINQKIGRFEVADGGTIFLDEIGELPFELQSKLLRVLQQKKFERVGGSNTITTDVRIIAATNRDLEKEVEKGAFRADLFFRLNVFPILSPALRDRLEDIPLLVKHFAKIHCKKLGKNVTSIRKKDLETLVEYNWPGNVRELNHFVERSVIISENENLTFPELKNVVNQTDHFEKEDFKSLVELEKEHIMRALKLANGKVTGENSASQLLGINGKTLGSKMRKFGIKREIVIVKSD